MTDKAVVTHRTVSAACQVLVVVALVVAGLGTFTWLTFAQQAGMNKDLYTFRLSASEDYQALERSLRELTQAVNATNQRFDGFATGREMGPSHIPEVRIYKCPSGYKCTCPAGIVCLEEE